MFFTIISGLLIVTAIALAFFPIKFKTGTEDIIGERGYRTGSKPAYKTITRAVALIPLGIAALVLALCCTTIVQAKQVGVVTTFGKPTASLNSGLHLKAPWQKVTAIDATTQTDEYHGDSCITVVLADKNTACISATNRWSVNKKNAHDVYADFRSDDPTKSLRDAVVSTQFKAAVNDVFGAFDVTAPGATDTEGLAKAVRTKALAATDGLVDIDRITISFIRPSDRLQSKIENIQAQEAKTRIADEAKTTASKQADANRILSDSLSRDPNVLVSKCFDLLEDGYDAPAGFSCWPGGGGSVVIPATK